MEQKLSSAGLIFYKRQKYLISIVVSNTGEWNDNTFSKWNFPKGKIEFGKDLDYVDTALREVNLKTGLSVPREWVKKDCFKCGNTIFYFVDLTLSPPDFFDNINSIDPTLDVFYRWVSKNEMANIPENESSVCLKRFCTYF